MPFFEGSGGRVYYRHWESIGEAKAVAVFLHGVGEHSGHYHRFAAHLNHRGISVWGLDQLGHGLSGGERGAVTSIEALAENARSLAAIAAQAETGKPMALVGHSLGGIVASLMASRDATPFKSIALTGTPLSLDYVIVSPAEVTRDPFYLDMLATDPLAVTFTEELVTTRRAALAIAKAEIAEKIGAIQLPILVINGDKDTVAPAEASRKYLAAMANAEVVEFQDTYHDMINDCAYYKITERIASFILKHV